MIFWSDDHTSGEVDDSRRYLTLRDGEKKLLSPSQLRVGDLCISESQRRSGEIMTLYPITKIEK